MVLPPAVIVMGYCGQQITQVKSPRVKEESLNNRLPSMSSKAVVFYSVPNWAKVNV